MDADSDNAARKIVDGRFKNTGQFCVAPDYVLCEEDEDLLIREDEGCCGRILGQIPRLHPRTRIVNTRRAARVAALIDSKHGGKIIWGNYDVDARYVSPTIIDGPDTSSELMQNEIFGPILPVVTLPSNDFYDAAAEFVNDRPTPLAMYVFTSKSAEADYLVSTVSSGGACVNDVIIHMLNERLRLVDSERAAWEVTMAYMAFGHSLTKGVMFVTADDDGQTISTLRVVLCIGRKPFFVM